MDFERTANKPILVTGTHRSGSTWVGKMLNLSPRTYYLGEIFNPQDGRINSRILKYQFFYIPLESRNDHEIFDPLNKIICLDFKWPNRSGVRRFLPSKLIFLKQTRKWLGYPTPIMKDPIAILSSEWLAETFKMIVIGIIRHPVAFVLSIKRQNWGFPFSQLLKQTGLIDNHLTPYESLIEKPPQSFHEQGALAWVCLNHVFTAYIQNHPEWNIWRYEDICCEPLISFKEIYRQCNLNFTTRIEKKINEYSNQDNPVENTPGHLIKRDSRSLQDSWRGKLSSKELSSIRRIVEPISHLYYNDDDW